MAAKAETVRLESRSMIVTIDTKTGAWSLTDARSRIPWPSEGAASAGSAKALQGGFQQTQVTRHAVTLTKKNGVSVTFELVDRGRALEIRYGGEVGDVTALGDALTVTDVEGGYAIVPCREGLLIPADSGVSFRHAFGTSEYEGCHMNMLGFARRGSALIVTWDDAYVTPQIESVRPRGEPYSQRLTTTLSLRRTARTLRLMPLGPGDWNSIAAAYRQVAESRGFAVTLRDRIRRDPHAELMVGAANVKLWTCLARRMNEESTKEEEATVRWTFDEAAKVAEHIRRDLGIARCLFTIGGWTEGGYDCRHPDNLPANPECGGNAALADAIRRIQSLGFLACLHDNYQDMYRDAKSWDPAYIEKRPDGTLIQGGRWLGGRAFMVCAPRQLELAQRPQNLPEIQRLFGAWSYFIDTTYAVGPRECSDPKHPIGRNDDIAWKARLSDYARQVFGLFGSECGREWALPHSDFFEGLVGVGGRYFHDEQSPARFGARVIPFWEMVYHDCQIAYGKYGYSADAAAEYVLHHILCARPLHYHSMPDHLYWQTPATPAADRVEARPRVVSIEAAGPAAFRIRYAWDVAADVAGDWRIFVHFAKGNEIRFQDDHDAQPPTSSWKKGQTVEISPRLVQVPEKLAEESLDVAIGLFDPKDVAQRAKVLGSDAQRRVLAGRLVLKPQLRFEPASPAAAVDRSCFTRSDKGWAEGFCPTDVFLKNTQEILGPLHAVTAHERLTRLEFLTLDRTLRRATYGSGKAATIVTANFGSTDATMASKLGGDVLLPPWGFVVESPSFAAFYAKRWAGQDYPDGALFTLSAEGDTLESAKGVRVFHGFGLPRIIWRGNAHEIPREMIVDSAR